jgi:hypothetical protein
MTSPPDVLYAFHLAVMVLNGAAAGLLGLLLWNASITNYDEFTKVFLKMLAGAAWGHGLAIAAQMYRAGRLLAENVPVDGAVIGLVGRMIECAAFCVPIWFMLRPETRRALKGASRPKPVE